MKKIDIHLTKEQQDTVTKNIQLVKYTLCKYMKSKIDEDLISEGYIGLCKAATSYNPNNKIKFSTYAVLVIYTYANREIKFRLRQKRKPELPIASLNTTCCGKTNTKTIESTGEDDLELINAIPDESIDVEETVLNHILYEQIAPLVPLQAEQTKNGLTIRQNAKLRGINKSTYDLRRKSEIKKAIKQLKLKPEDVLY